MKWGQLILGLGALAFIFIGLTAGLSPQMYNTYRSLWDSGWEQLHHIADWAWGIGAAMLNAAIGSNQIGGNSGLIVLAGIGFVILAIFVVVKSRRPRA